MVTYKRLFEIGTDSSGNHGHAGRPGEVGGSAPDGSGPTSKTPNVADLVKSAEVSEAYKKVQGRIDSSLSTIKSGSIKLTSVSGSIGEGSNVAAVFKNGKEILNAHGNYLTSDCYGKVRDFLDDTKAAVTAAIKEGLSAVSAEDINNFVQDGVKKLIYQEIESNRQQYTDHGIRHIVGNMQRQVEIMECLKGSPLTGMEKLMAATIMLNHDMGYTSPEVTAGGDSGIKASKNHKEFSKDIFNEQKSLWNAGRIFSAEQFGRISDIIGSHDGTDADSSDLMKVSAQLSDNLALFAREKLPGMFRYVEGSESLLVRLGEAASKKDTKVFKEVQGELYSAIDKTTMDRTLKRDLKAATSQLNFMSPKFALGTLAGEITKISGKKSVVVDIKYNKWDSFLQKYFDMGQRQTKKLLEDYGHKDFTKNEYKIGKFITIRVNSVTREEFGKIQEGGPGSGRKPGIRGNDRGRKPGAKNLKNRMAAADAQNIPDVVNAILNGPTAKPPEEKPSPDGQQHIPGMPAQGYEKKDWNTPTHHELILRNGKINNIRPLGTRAGINDSYRATVTGDDGTSVDVCYKIDNWGARYCEEFSSIIDRVSEFGMIPPTVVRDDGPQPPGRGGAAAAVGLPANASLMRWEKGRPGMSVNPDDLPVEECEKLVGIDVIVGNTDRHAKNWMYDAESKKIWAIDNGFALEGGNPDHIRCSPVAFNKIKNTPVSPAVKKALQNFVDRKDYLTAEAVKIPKQQMREQIIRHLNSAVISARKIIKLEKWPSAIYDFPRILKDIVV